MNDVLFLRTIQDRPNENGPHLVFADWLDETGQCERAAIIRSTTTDYLPTLRSRSAPRSRSWSGAGTRSYSRTRSRNGSRPWARTESRTGSRPFAWPSSRTGSLSN